MKIKGTFRQNFATFLISLLEIFFQKFHLSFALGDYRHKHFGRFLDVCVFELNSNSLNQEMFVHVYSHLL